MIDPFGLFDESTSPDPDTWKVSPSQIDTFLSCQRKWAWKYIAKADSPQAPSAALGERVHHILEDYLRTGALPPQDTREGQIATSGLHLLPTPNDPALQIERKITFRSPGGFLFTGRVDLTYPHGGMEIVLDHKTTSNFRWMKTPEVLSTDPQALVYAAHSLLETGDPLVGLRWIYYRTRGAPEARPVETTFTAEHVEKSFPLLDNAARNIHLVLRTCKDPLSLPPTIETCEAYGGCPFQHLCNITISERISSMTQGPIDTAALLLRLQQQASPPPVPPPIAPPAPPQIPPAAPSVPPPANPPGLSVLEQLRMNRPPALPTSQPAPPPAAPPVVPPPVPTVAPGTWYASADGSPMYPCVCGHHSSVADVSSTNGTCIRCGARVPGAEIFCPALGGNPPPAINPPEAGLTPPPTPPPPAETKPKAGPGRPKKNPTPAGAPASRPERPIRRLYIDISGPSESAEDLIFAPCRQAVNQSQGVQDYRLMDFGKGAGVFAAAVTALLTAGGSWDALTVDSSTADAHAALSLLVSSSEEVYRGR